jgi:CDP-paratose 2-epimerase
MKVLPTGACGFVGDTIAAELHKQSSEIIGFNNLSRRGSELIRHVLHDIGITFRHGDVRSASDIDSLPYELNRALAWITL